MTQAFVCDGIRTPIGRYAGSLANVRTDDLAALPIKALMARNPGVDWQALDDVMMGCANQAGEDNRNVARMALLLAGIPSSVGGSTVNRLCGSGMEAVGAAARAIRAGDTSFMLAGGVESMSRAPFVMPKATSAFSRTTSIEDTTIGWRFVNAVMKAKYGIDSMPETAENVAETFAVSRADQDLFAWRSQQKAAAGAQRRADEIMPVELAGKKGAVTLFSHDEHARADTTLEALTALPAPFRKGGSVTAGNASGVNDGACALIVASEAAATKQGLTPLARIITMATAGVEPRLMGIGPIDASRKALALTGLKADQLSIIELNEAFAAQGLAVLRQLGVGDDDARVNRLGGAIALGHPLGMSGARLILTATRQLQETGGRYALCTMCIGVGQGIAIVLERV